MPHRIWPWIVGLLAALVGCAAEAPPSPPTPPPLVANIAAFRAPADPGAPRPAATYEQDTPDEITLPEALARALTQSPRLQQYAWSIREREAEALQAGLFPNPEIETELEEFGGTGDLSGFDAAEVTVALSQVIELGGKRRARREAAGLGQQLASWDYEVERLALFSEVKQAFIELFGRQDALALAEELLDLASALEDAAAARVEAGEASPVESTKAAVAVSSARIERDRARRDLEVARSALAALWGESEPQFRSASGSWPASLTAPPLDRLLPFVESHPTVERASLAEAQQRAWVREAEARAVPDLTLTAGIRHLEEIGDQGVLVGFGIPIPLFDRNQGERLARRHGAEAGRAAHAEALTEARVALTRSYRELVTARQELRTLEGEILPAAETALDATREGYRSGKFGYLDVLDAQRSLFEASRSEVEARIAYHHARVALEHWIGRSLDTLDEPAAAETLK